VWFTSWVLSLLVALEIVGRLQATSDVHDLLAASVLVLLGLLVALRHHQEPLGWLSSLIGLGRPASKHVGKFTFQIGIDLRGSPPLPRGYPPSVVGLLVLCLAWLLTILIVPGWFPLGLRVIASQVCYVGYLAVLVGMWGVLLLLGLASVFIPWAMLHDLFITSGTGPARYWRNWEHLGLPIYLSALFLAQLVLPIWVPLALCLLALLVNLATIAIPSNPDVKFIWRLHAGGQVYCLTWGRWVTCEFTLLTLGVVNLALTACAGVALGHDAATSETMRITTLFGQAVTWLAPGALCALVGQTVAGRLRDPARSGRPTVHIAGHPTQPQRDELKALFAQRGWEVRLAPAPPQPGNVRVKLIDADPADRPDAWPLPVRLADLHQPAVLERLQRRDEIQKRRRLISGLELLFKQAARRKYKRGSGYWVAPHYWFINGLLRDENEEELDFREGTIWTGTIGPAYHRVLPRNVRHYYYQMMRALEIDLVFVEDGVGFRRYCRVLRLMFEVFDIYGGRRRADEMHFQGVPGTRVLIHEYVLQDPFKSELYPEPEFENLGRARLLHIFRDRGEQFERIEPPGDFSNIPVPSAAF
jgi:hypothetical protein